MEERRGAALTRCDIDNRTILLPRGWERGETLKSEMEIRLGWQGERKEGRTDGEMGLCLGMQMCFERRGGDVLKAIAFLKREGERSWLGGCGGLCATV